MTVYLSFLSSGFTTTSNSSSETQTTSCDSGIKYYRIPENIIKIPSHSESGKLNRILEEAASILN
jgi:hypothetical protein